MHAWRTHAYGPPESLVWEPVTDVPLADGQVRIEVKAAAINFPDVLFVAGLYQVRPAPPFGPGFEVAGVVTESRSPALPNGTPVAATVESGGYATHVVAPDRMTSRIPDGMPFTDAAALTLTYQTAWFALHRRARIQRGEWLLVHAGAGGVGSASIQLGKAAGARVIATAGGARKAEACRALGAELVVDYTQDDFVPAVKTATQGRGVDVVIDPVGGDVFDKSTKCIAFEGRIVVIGFTSGRIPEAKANHVLVKNYGVLGLHWGMYNVIHPALVAEAQAELYGLYAKGAIKPLVSELAPMGDAPAALKRVAGRESVGKVVLVP